MAASRSWVGICTRTDGCILQARHAGACKVGDVGEEDYEVESILDQRGAGRALEYLVKWKGWPAEDSTWEPKSALGSGGVAWEAESPGRVKPDVILKIEAESLNEPPGISSPLGFPP